MNKQDPVSRDILISEVAPRDGLQNISSILPTATKVEWLQRLADCGVGEIEAGSFVSAKLIPQLADTAELLSELGDMPGVSIAVLVPNRRGLQAALAAGAGRISIPFSMSETHSIRNVNRSHAQMLEEIAGCLALLDELPAERRPGFEVGLSTAFGCSIEGRVPTARVIAMAEKVIAMGVDEVCLSDTTGAGNPRQLQELVEGIWANCGRKALDSVHLHNTRGQGLANALRAIDLGIRTVDSSQGGLGGCPAAPGASGNIVTEDLVFLLESMGLKTGIDLDKLLSLREWLQQQLPNEELYGFTAAAGVPKGF